MCENKCKRFFPVSVSALIYVLPVICLIFLSASGVKADGEIYLNIGDQYLLPCLQQDHGQEYEILIDNPDIVGLNETGKCIVGIAPGATEVTVLITDTGSSFIYSFLVSEYYEPYYDDIYYDAEEGYADVQEDIYDPVESPVSEVQDNEYSRPDRTDSEESEHTDGSGKDRNVQSAGDSDSRSSAGSSDESSQTDDHMRKNTKDRKDGEKEQMKAADGSRKDPKNAGGYDKDLTETDAGNTNRKNGPAGREADRSTQTNDGHGNCRITFSHGQGIHDILVPPHYTMWIGIRSASPVSVLYVGAEGIPIPYYRKENILYIKSDDMKPGNHLIRLIAADPDGKIHIMRSYGVSIC